MPFDTNRDLRSLKIAGRLSAISNQEPVPPDGLQPPPRACTVEWGFYRCFSAQNEPKVVTLRARAAADTPVQADMKRYRKRG
jgi:hypothetical protein